MIQLRLLGPFELRSADGAAVAVPGRQSMAILACLGVSEDLAMARDRLAELIWPGRGEQADNSLRQELNRLRRSVGEALEPTAHAGPQPVQLNPARIDVDVGRFRAAAAGPGGGSEAIALYRGPLLEGFPLRPHEPLGDWIGANREHLSNAARALMLRLLRSGEGSGALAERLVALDPLCEEAYRYLIKRSAAAGDLAGARRWYLAAEDAATRNGLETSLEIRSLFEQAKAEIAQSSVSVFQIALPTAETETTEWLRASLNPAGALRRPPGRAQPEILDRPSAAVLPFDDLTGPSGANDSFFGDFVTEEVTAALSRTKDLFVAARHSAAAYRGAAVDARVISAELGVRYLIEGGIVRATGGLRCNVRLIDGRSGLSIWADSVESPDHDERTLGESIVHATVGRLGPRLYFAEIARAHVKRGEPRDAYEARMRARAELLREQPFGEALDKALNLARAALKIDPDDAEANALAAYVTCLRGWSRLSPTPLVENWRATRHMHRALAVDRDNAEVLSFCAETALLSANDINLALALVEAAIERQPDDPHALALLGHVRRMAGEDPRASLMLIERAERLSPRDPRTFLWLLYGAWCHWKLAQYEPMEAMARRSISLYPNIPWNWLGLAGALALQEKHGEAADALATLRAMMPTYTPSRFHWGARWVYGPRFGGHTERDYRGLRDALNKSLAAGRRKR